MAGREHISLKTKLAAAICELFGIPYEHALLMHEDQVLSLVHWDHYPHRRVEGLKNGMSVAEVDHHSNLVPKLIRGHRKKTAEVDVPEIAKNKRVAERHAEHLAKVAAKAGGTDPKRNALVAAQVGIESENLDALAEGLKPLGREGLMFPKPVRRQKSKYPMRSGNKLKMRGSL